MTDAARWAAAVAEHLRADGDRERALAALTTALRERHAHRWIADHLSTLRVGGAIAAADARSNRLQLADGQEVRLEVRAVASAHERSGAEPIVRHTIVGNAGGGSLVVRRARDVEPLHVLAFTECVELGPGTDALDLTALGGPTVAVVLGGPVVVPPTSGRAVRRLCELVRFADVLGDLESVGALRAVAKHPNTAVRRAALAALVRLASG